MLSHLFISNFVLVAETEIDFHSGLTILTGKTGAGKSIIFDALGLAMGSRAESRSIRHGCEQAEIVATFQQLTAEILEWLEQHELENSDPQELILRRVVRSDGHSRAFINGTPSTIQALRELSSLLLDIQGQHAHQRLLKREEQLRLLDCYAGTEPLLEHMDREFRGWEGLIKSREELERSEAERSDRIALLEFQLQEFAQLGLLEGEVAELESEQSQLANGEQLLEQGQQALQLLDGEESERSAVQQLHRAVARLEALGSMDPEIRPLHEALLESTLQIIETLSDLTQQIDRYTLDPQRLQWLNQRLSTISDLARKHHCSGGELPQREADLRHQLEQLLTTEQQLNEIEQATESAAKLCLQTAQEIHQLRNSAAAKLQQEVSQEIQALGMEQGELRIALRPISAQEFRIDGCDEIEFQVSINRRGIFHPLARVASGGELSRVSLAIQIASANRGETPTLIFDEVDSGVGGATAEQIGQKLRTLGNHTQILCVTHLPQVAAQGHHHLRIEKEIAREESCSNISTLNSEERIEEIARMLGGVEITSQSRAHAEEMLGG